MSLLYVSAAITVGALIAGASAAVGATWAITRTIQRRRNR